APTAPLGEAGTYVPSKSAPAISAQAEVDAAPRKIQPRTRRGLVRAAALTLKPFAGCSMSILKTGSRCRRPSRIPPHDGARLSVRPEEALAAVGDPVRPALVLCDRDDQSAHLVHLPHRVVVLAGDGKEAGLEHGEISRPLQPTRERGRRPARH